MIEKMTKSERTLRRDVVKFAQSMNSLGINQGTSGNISVRFKDGFLVTPSNLPYESFRPEDIVRVYLDGVYTGPRKPSSEWRIHRDILVARPEVNAVIHAHPTFATSLACLRRPIPAFHYMVAVAGGKGISCAEYFTFGTQELSNAAIEALDGHTACLLANHGLLVVGESLESALASAVDVESLATQYCQVLQIGEPTLLSDAEMNAVLEKFHDYNHGAEPSDDQKTKPANRAARSGVLDRTITPAPNRTMRAAMLVGPEKIEIQELPVPQPEAGEILLGIEAATTCGTDVKVFMRGGHPRMLSVPTVFGHELSGRVVSVGPGVEDFAVGDAVFVANSAPCLECDQCRMERENLCEDLHYINGAFAEYILVPERFVRLNTYPIPDGLDFEKAALAEPLACVLHGIEACDLERYSVNEPVEVLVIGGGPIGQLFVAVLSLFNFPVIAADPNPSRLALAEKLGAKKTVVVDRGGSQADTLKAATKDRKGAWVAIDSTGVKNAWLDAINSVRPGGLVNLFGGCAPGTTIELDTSLIHYSELNIKGVYHHRPETIKRALELLTNPDFNVETILTEERPIDEIEAALRSMMTKEAVKIVIKPNLSRPM